jgi:hypothetical protein
VFEDEELNFDNRPEGVFVDFEPALGRARAIGASQDGNRFRGVFVEPNAWGPLRVGAGFVEMWGSGEDTFIQDREQDSGALAELTWGPATVYGEYVHREFPQAASDAGDAGRGNGASTAITRTSSTSSTTRRPRSSSIRGRS